MAEYAGEPVPIIVVDPVDANGVVLTNANASATVAIYSQDRSIVYVPQQAMQWIAGAFEYTWDTAGRDPGLYLARVGVTPTGGIESSEWQLLRLAALPGAPTCGGPWTDPEDIPALEGLEEVDRWLVVQAASDLLYLATAQQFHGVCSDTVRPPSVNCVGEYPPMTRLGDGSLWVGGGIDSLPFGFASKSVRLPGYPIVAVQTITIDGVDLPPGSWRIVDSRDVIRSDGLSWPSWQYLNRAAGDAGTWTIEYTWGNEIPPAGQVAHKVLSAELGKSLAGDSSCRLPKRLQNVSREGLSMVIVDPAAALKEWNEFGIYEVDELFVNKYNPARLTRDAKVINVDLVGQVPRHVR